MIVKFLPTVTLGDIFILVFIGLLQIYLHVSRIRTATRISAQLEILLGGKK